MVLTVNDYVLVYNYFPVRNILNKWPKDSGHDFSFRDINALELRGELELNKPRRFNLTSGSLAKWYFFRDINYIIYLMGALDGPQKFCDDFLKYVGIKTLDVQQSLSVIFE